MGHERGSEISRSITTLGPASWKSDIGLDLEGIATKSMLAIYSVNTLK